MHVENRARKRADVYVTNRNMTRWWKFRNCAKLVLKPLAAQNGLSILLLCIAPSLSTY